VQKSNQLSVESRRNENHSGKRIDQCKQRLPLCQIGLVKDHDRHLVQGFSNFFVLRPHFKKFFLGNPLMDSLDVNDTCKRPISLQKHLYLVCQVNLFRDPKNIFRDHK